MQVSLACFLPVGHPMATDVYRRRAFRREHERDGRIDEQGILDQGAASPYRRASCSFPIQIPHLRHRGHQFLPAGLTPCFGSTRALGPDRDDFMHSIAVCSSHAPADTTSATSSSRRRSAR
jgi:hypothetical protein